MMFRRKVLRAAVATAAVTAMAVLAAAGAASVSGAVPKAATAARQPNSAAGSCHLQNGIKHVVEILFDNVHFNRDNPNVPSDIEMIPSLEHFIENNGTLLSNNHTPLIAHTADDSITTYTGLYGDRAGMPISNSLPGIQRRRHH